MIKKAIYLLVVLSYVLLSTGCGTDPTPTVAVEPTMTDVPPTATEVEPTVTMVASSTETTAPEPVSDTATPAPPTESPTEMPTDAPASTATVAPQVEAAAMVNGEPIPMSEYEAQVALAEAAFRRQMGNNPQLDDPDAALQQVRRQVLDWMVDQKLMEQAAERLGVSVSPERVDAEFARAQGDNPVQFSEWLEDNGLTAQDFRVKLRAELLGTKMRDTVTEYLPEKMEQVHLRHILVNSRSQAESILDQIHSNEDFVRLAKEYSKDMSTRDNGGDLGFYPRGVLSPEIDRVAFNMVVGQVSDVIQTAFGYHIIQVLERSPQRELTPQMERALRQQMFMDWLAAERAKAEIVYLIE